MIETSGHILKKDDVELGGQYQLNLEQSNLEVSEPEQSRATLSEPQARIIENQPGYAVLEVTCSCGAKVCLKCEYSDAAMPESP